MQRHVLVWGTEKPRRDAANRTQSKHRPARVDNLCDSPYTPSIRRGLCLFAEFKTVVDTIRANAASILWKPTASFTSEWERWR